MRHLAVTALLCATALPALGAMPIFVANCDGKSVDADRTGTVHVNGARAAVKAVGNAFEARLGGVVYSITPQAGAPIVSFSGPGRANGMCQVTGHAAPPRPTPPRPAPPRPGAGGGSIERASQGRFDARGAIPCAAGGGAPMAQCDIGVAREGGGTATVVVNLPDGRKRMIFFTRGQATGADLSQADGDTSFRATRDSDLTIIRAGRERYEIPDAVVFGG